MRNYIANELIINFHSNAKPPFNHLSNLNEINDGIEYDNIIYPSVEQAYQAQKFIKKQRNRFSIEGDLGTWNGLKLFYKPDKYEKKYQYWAKKSNIGIIAKLASNPKSHKKLGLNLDDNFRCTPTLWLELLKKKYSIKFYNKLLKSTQDIYLLELDIHANNNNNYNCLWGGLIKNNTLIGDNIMGKYLMEIRKNL